MAIRDTLGFAKAKVVEHKDGGFESTEQEDTFLSTYAGGSIAQARADCTTAYSGSPRVQSFTPGSMTTQEKEDTGVDQINADLFTIYSHNSSYIVHEGEKGNTVWEEGTVYWMPCTGGNTEDFVNFKKLLERHMAYSYIGNEVSNSTAGEISDALGDYNTFKGTL